MKGVNYVTPVEVYERLYAAYGPQHWWPADSPFEMMVGAILTQNTNWKNVEQAIANLKSRDMLDAESIATSNLDLLAEVIRSSGFYKQKSTYLQNFARFYRQQGKREGLISRPLHLLRKQLLACRGIGPETADSMLLYALDKPVFVIDTYTKRLFIRLGLIDPSATYDSMQSYFQQHLTPDLPLYQEYHALIVVHAKRHCRSKPCCDSCPLFDHCINSRPDPMVGDRLGGCG